MKKVLKLCLPFILIILFVLLFFCLRDIYVSLSSDHTVKTLDSIENYNYTLNENDSKYYKKIFQELKDNLESEEINEEESKKYNNCCENCYKSTKNTKSKKNLIILFIILA